jgi:cytochrome c
MNYWEFNLRFKTDASPRGPAPGKPVLVGQGMQGDQAQVVFARSAEISAFIREGC